MTKRKAKPEVMWAITGEFGFYYKTNCPTRRTAIATHVREYGGDWTWEKCYARGDRAVKVEMKEVK